MEWSTVPRSRYLIKFHQNTQRVTFYLAGATQNGRHGSARQSLYIAILAALEEARDNGLITLNENDDVIQDIAAKMFDFQLAFDEETGLLHLYGNPIGQLGGIFCEKFGHNGLFDMGVIPNENQFAIQVRDHYNDLPEGLQADCFDISMMKKNAWGGTTILLGISMKVQSAEPVKEVVQESVQQTVEEEGIKESSTGHLIQFPYVPPMDTWEDVKNMLFAQYSSLALIKQMAA